MHLREHHHTGAELAHLEDTEDTAETENTDPCHIDSAAGNELEVPVVKWGVSSAQSVGWGEARSVRYQRYSIGSTFYCTFDSPRENCGEVDDVHRLLGVQESLVAAVS
jgi:hypothetical protein